MGAEQSRDSPHTTGFKRTETANFDFREDNLNGSSGYQQSRQKSANEQYNNNDRRMGKAYQDDSKTRNISHDNNRSNAYWLEVGMDVVKRLETGDNRFYSR